MASVPRRVLFALATSERFERLVRGVPGGERIGWRVARGYVAGSTREDAFAVAHRLASDGLSCSIDFFGEDVSDPIEADRVADTYVELAGALDQAPPGAYLSLDLSHVGVDQPGGVARARLARFARALPVGCRLQIGAEQAARADRILEAVIASARDGLAVSMTVQANLKRSAADASRLAEAEVPIRLVKGAYAENPAIAHPWGEATDVAFLELAHELHRAGVALTLGTHDAVLRDALLYALPGVGVEMLLGVRPDDAHALVARHVPVRIYVPYGEGWFRYAVRRAAEARRRVK